MAEEQDGVAMVSQAVVNADAFFNIDNVVTVDIDMDPALWIELKAAMPGPIPDPYHLDEAGNPYPNGECDSNVPAEIDRYKEYSANFTISGTNTNLTKRTYAGTVKKKSYCGSLSPDKPSLKIKIGSLAQTEFGVPELTLNNSVQDASYIRQIVGYELYKYAELPHSRANYAIVKFRGAPVDNGVYINVETIGGTSYIANPTNHFETATRAIKGNLYEFDAFDDFRRERELFVDVKDSHSPTKKTRVDFLGASDYLATLSPSQPDLYTAMSKVVDVNEMIGMLAMEFLLRHRDSYGGNYGNNTYIYNDADPTATLDMTKIKFKMLPWGIDLVLTPRWEFFEVYRDSVLWKLVMGNSDLTARVRAKIDALRESAFGRSKQSGELNTLITKAAAKLASFGINATDEIKVVQQQMRLARSAAFMLNGIKPDVPVFLHDSATDDAMCASSETIIPGNYYELIHKKADASATACLWRFDYSYVAANTLREANTGRYVHFGTHLESQYNSLIYTTPDSDTLGSSDFSTVAVDGSGGWKFTGYFALRNARTNNYLLFAARDSTALDALRVVQSYTQSDGTVKKTTLYAY
jgi:hypothetical protein